MSLGNYCQNRSDGGAAGNTQDVGIGEGIAEQRLEAGTGDGERGANENGEENARKANVDHDHAVIAGEGAGLVEQDANQIAAETVKGDGNGTELERHHDDDKKDGSQQAALQEEASRSGTVDGITDRGVATIAHSIEQTPAGKIGKSFGTLCGGPEMRFHKNQKFRLKMDDFLEVDLRPVLRGIDYRDSAGVTQRVGDERVVADGDEWLGPNNEENATKRQRSKAVVEIRNLVFEIGGERGTSFWGTEQLGKTSDRGDDGIDRMRIGGVRRDADFRERLDGFEAVQIFSD